MRLDENFKINLNQNLWALVVSYVALGSTAEHWGLKWLRVFSIVLATAATISVLVALIPYTMRYWRDKAQR